MTDPPAALAETRPSLHRLAEEILAAAAYRETGHVGLRPGPGGVGTPALGTDATVIAVEGTSLVVRSDSVDRRAQVGTVPEAAEFVGITPGGPASVYRLATNGFSPGAAFSAEPYVYLGPHVRPPANPSRNAPFGAFHTDRAVTPVDQAVGFRLKGRDRVAAAAHTTVEARSWS